jgi:YVTN family beta-propeller protein
MGMESNGPAQRRYVQPWLTYRRFQKWQEILALPAPAEGMPFVEGTWHFVRGSAFTALDRTEDAQHELEQLQTLAADPAMARLMTMVNPANTDQGDGTVSRVDAKTRKVTATITLGIPGPGGDICYGANSVWATVFDIPLTQIDSQTNKVLRQWVGRAATPFASDTIQFG